MPSDGVPYPVYTYAAMVLWTFFVNAVNNGGNSLVGNANLITKVYFPRIIMPAAVVAAGLVDFWHRLPHTARLERVLPHPIQCFGLDGASRRPVDHAPGAAVGLWMSAFEREVPGRPLCAPVFRSALDVRHAPSSTPPASFPSVSAGS